MKEQPVFQKECPHCRKINQWDAPPGISATNPPKPFIHTCDGVHCGKEFEVTAEDLRLISL